MKIVFLLFFCSLLAVNLAQAEIHEDQEHSLEISQLLGNKKAPIPRPGGQGWPIPGGFSHKPASRPTKSPTTRSTKRFGRWRCEKLHRLYEICLRKGGKKCRKPKCINRKKDL